MKWNIQGIYWNMSKKRYVSVILYSHYCQSFAMLYVIIVVDTEQLRFALSTMTGRHGVNVVINH